MSIDDVVDKLLAKRAINQEVEEKEDIDEIKTESQGAFRYLTKEEAIEQQFSSHAESCGCRGWCWGILCRKPRGNR